MRLILILFLSGISVFSGCGVKGDPQPFLNEEKPSRYRPAMGAIPASPSPTPTASASPRPSPSPR